MKRIFLPFVALILSMSAFAYDAATEGEKYYLSDCEAIGLSDGTVAITSYYKNVTEVTLPAVIEKWEETSTDHWEKTKVYQVSQIGNGSALYFEAGRASITSLTIPEGVTTIAASAFSEATSLQTLTIEGNIVVGDWAFYGCEALTSIVFNGTNMLACGTEPFKGSTSWDAIINQCTVTVKSQAAKDSFNHDPWDHWTAFYSNNRIVVKTATAIDKANANAKAIKRIVNGQLFIERDGHIFNAQGIQIK